eukprot:TRINITY_DN23456_c0_g1_i1.p1 TRINITY_DN23456_c0_g1~~TRINITY_DN23456_c0_g1_i1.p1  ORF type:complete len:109 (-),score=22.45 TRINITY_DN23456_c0_g1_i1:81-407(-)
MYEFPLPLPSSVVVDGGGGVWTTFLHRNSPSTLLLLLLGGLLQGQRPTHLKGVGSEGLSLHLEVLRLSLIHISEPTRLLSISYAVFCLKKKKKNTNHKKKIQQQLVTN